MKMAIVCSLTVIFIDTVPGNKNLLKLITLKSLNFCQRENYLNMNSVLISSDEATTGMIRKYLVESPFKNDFSLLENHDNLFFDAPDESLPDLLIADTAYIPPEKIAVLKNYCSYLVLMSNDKADAYEAIESVAFDFLLKPVSKKRFGHMLNKISHHQKNPYPPILFSGKNETTNRQTPNAADSFIFVKSGIKIHKINLSDIKFLEKQGNYFIIHEKNQRKIILRTNFRKIMELLPYPDFIRIHKSYIIGLRHIEFIEGNEIAVDNEKIPVSTAYKEALMKLISQTD
jgi:DNA-binding LytR/AlgR family response regulator